MAKIAKQKNKPTIKCALDSKRGFPILIRCPLGEAMPHLCLMPSRLFAMNFFYSGVKPTKTRFRILQGEGKFAINKTLGSKSNLFPFDFRFENIPDRNICLAAD